MKKIISLILVTSLLLLFVACNGTSNSEDKKNSTPTSSVVVDNAEHTIAPTTSLSKELPTALEDCTFKIGGKIIVVGETTLGEIADAFDFGYTNIDTDIMCSFEKLDRITNLNGDGKITFYLTSPKHNVPTIMRNAVIVGIDIDYWKECETLNVSFNDVSIKHGMSRQDLESALGGLEFKHSANENCYLKIQALGGSDYNILNEISYMDDRYFAFEAMEDEHSWNIFTEYNEVITDYNQVKIGGKVYTLPFESKELLQREDVFLLYTGDFNTGYVDSPKVRILQTDGTVKEVSITLENPTDPTNSLITGVGCGFLATASTEEETALMLYNDITWGSSYDAIVATFGVPYSEQEAFGYYVLSYNDGKNQFYLDTKTMCVETILVKEPLFVKVR